jgi:hypothetical protein
VAQSRVTPLQDESLGPTQQAGRDDQDFVDHQPLFDMVARHPFFFNSQPKNRSRGDDITLDLIKQLTANIDADRRISLFPIGISVVPGSTLGVMSLRIHVSVFARLTSVFP